MKKILFPILVLFLFSFNLFAFEKSDELSSAKMTKVTKEILDAFVKGTADNLRSYISEEWLEDKKINIKKYKINNYTPDFYEILFASGDICVATIGGKSWSHLLAFKFTEEYGQYRVIPMGISKASSDYIEPWWYVKDYICSEYSETDK